MTGRLKLILRVKLGIRVTYVYLRNTCTKMTAELVETDVTA